jgi:HEAT repeat protein
MNTQPLPAPRLVAAAVALAAAAPAAETASVNELIARIKDKDDKVRGPAWQGAGTAGAPAVQPLAAVTADPDFEIARAAKRALWQIVRHAGRPGADTEARAVVAELLPLLTQGDSNLRREYVWMLSEIGGDESVGPLSALLAGKELREDARAALQRIPGRKSLDALKAALKTAPEDYRPAIAVSLRARGEKVTGYPSRKLVPTRPKGGKPPV